MRSKLVLLLAIIMGLVTTFLFYNYMKTYDQALVSTTHMVEVVTAQQPIKKNQKISKELLSLAQVPENAVHPQAIKSMAEAEGLYALGDITTGEIILSHRLGKEREEKLFVSRKIQQGYRGVSVGVNFVQSVSNLIEPEDWVDVVFSEQPDKSMGETKAQTTLLLSKVRVLAIGRRMIEATSEEPYVEYSSVTLELLPEDAVKLINASERGNIQFILHTKVIPSKEGSGNVDSSS